MVTLSLRLERSLQMKYTSSCSSIQLKSSINGVLSFLSPLRVMHTWDKYKYWLHTRNKSKRRKEWTKWQRLIQGGQALLVSFKAWRKESRLTILANSCLFYLKDGRNRKEFRLLISWKNLRKIQNGTLRMQNKMWWYMLMSEELTLDLENR